MFAIGRDLEVLERTYRYDARRIDVVVCVVIVPFDMVEIDGGCDAGDLIEVAQIAIEIRVVDNAAQIALEVPVVNRIEANQRYEGPPIRFNGLLSEQKPTRCKALLEPIQHRKHAIGRFFVRGLAGGEA